MSEKKPKTASEIRAEQQARQAVEQKQQREAQEADFKRQQEALNADVAAKVKALRASWSATVEEVAKKGDFGFVVLAWVVESHKYPALQELIAEIKAAEYEVLITNVTEGRGGADLFKNEEGTVYLHHIEGWAPKNLPKIGSSGSSGYLIVKWRQ